MQMVTTCQLENKYSNARGSLRQFEPAVSTSSDPNGFYFLRTNTQTKSFSRIFLNTICKDDSEKFVKKPNNYIYPQPCNQKVVHLLQPSVNASTHLPTGQK